MQINHVLVEHEIRIETLHFPPAYTAQRRAEHLGITGKRVVKTVLAKGPAGYVLAVLPASSRLDTEALARVLEGPVRLADADEVAQVFNDCEWGAIPPFGSRYGIPTFLDASLPADAVLILPSHFHHEALRLRCADYERLEKPRRVALQSR